MLRPGIVPEALQRRLSRVLVWEELPTVAMADDEEEEYTAADILSIMVATDNHVGVFERDPIRGEDSFLAFEEILALARHKKVALVLLAGDLFHENKPSRYTLWRCVVGRGRAHPP